MISVYIDAREATLEKRIMAIAEVSRCRFFSGLTPAAKSGSGQNLPSSLPPRDLCHADERAVRERGELSQSQAHKNLLF
jgi:hypothetical protein